MTKEEEFLDGFIWALKSTGEYEELTKIELKKRLERAMASFKEGVSYLNGVAVGAKSLGMDTRHMRKKLKLDE